MGWCPAGVGAISDGLLLIGSGCSCMPAGSGTVGGCTTTHPGWSTRTLPTPTPATQPAGDRSATRPTGTHHTWSRQQRTATPRHVVPRTAPASHNRPAHRATTTHGHVGPSTHRVEHPHTNHTQREGCLAQQVRWDVCWCWGVWAPDVVPWWGSGLCWGGCRGRCTGCCTGGRVPSGHGRTLALAA